MKLVKRKGYVGMKKNKKWIITLVAIATALVGAAVAIGAYLKKKAAAISEDLDFDADFYDEDDDFFAEGSDEPQVLDDTGDDGAELGVEDETEQAEENPSEE